MDGLQEEPFTAPSEREEYTGVAMCHLLATKEKIPASCFVEERDVIPRSTGKHVSGYYQTLIKESGWLIVAKSE